MTYSVYCLGTITGIYCNDEKPITISTENYIKQLSMADALWKCPTCGGQAAFNEDDDS